MTTNKKTFLFWSLTIAFIGILILSFFVVKKSSNITQNKSEDIIERHQEWMNEMITSSDTIIHISKQQIDSINKNELKRLKEQDSIPKN